MLLKENALEIKIRPYYSKTCTQYRFSCTKCAKELWYRKSELKRVSGLCGKCNRNITIKLAIEGAKLKTKKRKYERVFNNFKRLNRDKENTITYDQFLEFCNDSKCHYCLIEVKRTEYGTGSMAYFLDRKDNNIGYTKENCVTCCSKCNYTKSNKYTYVEWFGMTEYFRNLNNENK